MWIRVDVGWIGGFVAWPREIGRLDLVDASVDLLARPAHHDAAALHDVDAVGDVERLANVLLDQQDAGRSLARDPPHRLEQALHHHRREAE